MFSSSVAFTMNYAWIIFCGCTKGKNENISPRARAVKSHDIAKSTSSTRYIPILIIHLYQQFKVMI